jgi:phosphatidylserine/phosphatidylglycerophosphate/cardiolipin synthase-like enzyme
VPHNFMHDKLIVADNLVVTGSFNFSNHARGNAENTLIIGDPQLAQSYEGYIRALAKRYSAR